MTEDFYTEDGNAPAPGKSRFASARRNVRLGQIGNMYDFASDFLVGQDAFEPGIKFGYFFGQVEPEEGESGVVMNPGFGAFYPRESG